MVRAHKTALHPRIKINDIPKICPIRVAARRQNELMAIIASGEMEDAEWPDDDQVDTTAVTMPPPATALSAIPVVADLNENLWKLQ